MKKTLTLALLCCLCLSSAFAQTRISGRVVDAGDGQAIPFVTVMIKGTTTVTQTDMDGRYAITVANANQVLSFSFVGYATQEITVGTRTVIDVLLPVDAMNLDEVLVTAYGTSTRKSFTGSAAQMSGEKLASRPVMNINQALNGFTSGVQVTGGSGQPGSSPTVRIRGIGSINASTTPLYIVDGFPMAGSYNDIPAEDIASVTVLKDAAASALYGNRAANGVIMITTKKGAFNEKLRVNISAKQGIVVRRMPELETMNHKDWVEIMWETYRNGLVSGNVSMEAANIRASSAPKSASGSYTDGVISKILYNPYNVPADQMVGLDGKLNPNAKLLWPDDLDWWGALSRTGKRGDYSVSASGGSEKSSYAASASYLKEEGYIMRTEYQRLTARASGDFKPKDWFKFGVSVNASITEEEYSGSLNDGGSGYANPFYFARNVGPIYPIHVHDQTTGAMLYDDAGQSYWDWGGRTDLGSPARPFAAGRHIVAEMLYNMELSQRQALTGNIYAEISPIKGLTIKTSTAGTFQGRYVSRYDNKIVGDGSPAGRASREALFYRTWTNTQTANYTNAFDKHSFTILAGHESYAHEYDDLYGFRQGQVMDGNTELINFTVTNNLTSSKDRITSEGYFGSANYSFDNKYNISASFRRDGSSRFHKDNRWGNFWSVGGAWRLEREPFIQELSWINQLKFRASYGSVGNDGLSGYYPYMALYSIGHPNASEPGTLQSSLPNNDLKWEVNTTLDLALEFGLFNKLSGSFEFFHRISDNLLFGVPLPLSSGAANYSGTSASITRNIGTMYNRGVEFQLEYDAVRQKDFAWRLALNATSYQNRITKLPEDSRENGIISGTKKLMEGRSRYDFWLRQWWGVDPDTGNSYAYLDTDAVAYNPSNADHKIIGTDTLTRNISNGRYYYTGHTSLPKVFGSISSNLRYKRLSLDFMFTWALGAKMYDGTYVNFMAVDANYSSAKHIDMLNRWQKPGDITNVPRLDDAFATSATASGTDRYLISGNYLNLQSVTLSYQLPTSIKGKNFLSGATLYLTADNLFMLSARKGLDPTGSIDGTTGNSYAPSRAVILGLNISL